MAAEIVMSDESGRTKVAFQAVSAIKQKDLANAVGGALQHVIIMRYMLKADHTEQGVTAATWDTQEEWLLRRISCGFWTTTVVTKHTRRRILLKPPKSRSSLRPPLMRVSSMRLI